jgi:hypothetical protein
VAQGIIAIIAGFETPLQPYSLNLSPAVPSQEFFFDPKHQKVHNSPRRQFAACLVFGAYPKPEYGPRLAP